MYHLEGGILQYLEDVPKEDTLWKGDCFVFDNRVAVNHRLEKGIYDQCHACRMPITEEDKLSEDYVKGVSCPKCIGKHTDQQMSRFREREKQMQLSKSRGQEHIGTDMKSIIEANRKKKLELKKDQRELNRSQ